jgi:hypothetical protein
MRHRKTQNATMKFFRKHVMRVSWIQQVFAMPSGSAIRLTSAKSAILRVQEGLVWITEEGVKDDFFLNAGESYVVLGEGLVIVSAEKEARIVFNESASAATAGPPLCSTEEFA